MLRKKIFLVISVSAVFTLFLVFENASTHDVYDYQQVTEFWEGEFMPGNNLTLILTFQKNNNSTVQGRIYLYQANIQIQDDPLQNIHLNNNQISFYIEAKNTSFEGILESNGTQITGEFQFPDGSIHPIHLKKVTEPSIGNLSKHKIGEREKFILQKKFSVKQLQDDLNFLRDQLEETHPQLYLFNSKQYFDKLFRSSLQSIQTEMTVDEFFRLIAPIVVKVNCSHTDIRFSTEFSDALKNGKNLIPLEIQFFDNRAYIIANYSENKRLKPGMQILSINEKSISQIWNKLTESISSDAFNMTYKKFRINNNFSHEYSLYIGNYDQFDIKCKTAAGTIIKIKLPAQNTIKIEKAVRNLHPERFSSKKSPLHLQTINEIQTAILSIKDFWASNPEEFNTFLHKSFTRMKAEHIKHLIIDVRGNKGGHPFFAAELLTYLIKSDITYFKLAKEQGEFAPLYKPLKCKEDNFKGKIYVLMNGGCLSTTGHFLSLIKYYNLATLIGEESGGTFFCNDRSIQVPLPHTKIILNLPQTTFQTAVTGFKKGDPLLPDHFVIPTLDDLLNGHDADLDFALKLIKKNVR